MIPAYLNELRYTYLVGSWRPLASGVYAAENPETAFEQDMHELFLTGQQQLHREEYTLALSAFQETRARILLTVHPSMPVDPAWFGAFKVPFDLTLVDTLITKTAGMLRATQPVRYQFPTTLVDEHSSLSTQAQEALKPFTDMGLKIASFHAAVSDTLTAGLDAAGRKDWRHASELYRQALDAAPPGELAVRGAILHDLAIIDEQAGDLADAQEHAMASVEQFTAAKQIDGQAQALAASVGIFARAGNQERAAELGKELDQVRQQHVLTGAVRISYARIIASP
jgi:hypothetical protein